MKPKLNPDGSEVIDNTPVAMPVSRFQSTNDMDIKLKAMVMSMLEDRREITEEDEIDELTDWELPDDKPRNNYSDKTPSKKELISELTKVKAKLRKKAMDARQSDGRKSHDDGDANRPQSKNKVAKPAQSEAEASDE